LPLTPSARTDAKDSAPFGVNVKGTTSVLALEKFIQGIRQTNKRIFLERRSSRQTSRLKSFRSRRNLPFLAVRHTFLAPRHGNPALRPRNLERSYEVHFRVFTSEIDGPERKLLRSYQQFAGKRHFGWPPSQRFFGGNARDIRIIVFLRDVRQHQIPRA